MDASTDYDKNAEEQLRQERKPIVGKNLLGSIFGHANISKLF